VTETTRETPSCPYCARPLTPVRYPGGYLNEDQFDSIRKGDWFCENCPGWATQYRYFWNSELASRSSAPSDAVPAFDADGESTQYRGPEIPGAAPSEGPTPALPVPAQEAEALAELDRLIVEQVRSVVMLLAHIHFSDPADVRE
jgi:hypothetical protein